MDRDRVVDAMAAAIAQVHTDLRAAADGPRADAWLQEGIDIVIYDRPSGADPEGFVTVGELRDLHAERTGFVLLHPETKAVRIAWSNDFGN